MACVCIIFSVILASFYIIYKRETGRNLWKDLYDDIKYFF